MELVALVVVGIVVVAVLGLSAWSGLRAVAGARMRGPRRDLAVDALPHGLAEAVREPASLRAPFALTARGDVVDIGQVWLGAFRGGELAMADLHVRLGPGRPAVAHTVVTVAVEHRWPWTRLRDAAAPAVAVDVAASDPGGDPAWVLEARDPELAARLVTDELRAWLTRIGRPVVVEFTPRNLLVAVPERLRDDELAAFVALAVGVVDHVPVDVRAAVAPDEEPDGPSGS